MHSALTTAQVDKKALKIIQGEGGIIRTRDAVRSGIHPRTLYRLRDNGLLERISLGVYRITELGEIDNPDFVILATRVPNAILCLISALAFHEMTTQIPHTISIALAKGSEMPRLDHPPLSVHRFTDDAFKAGIEEHVMDGVIVKVYCAEKTLADCFKFRNKIGMDIVLEALKLYKTRQSWKPNELIKYAKICRVDKIMRPYLEAMT